MWTYDKKLQFPVNIKQTNAKLAKAIITQYGGRYAVVFKNAEIPHYTTGLRDVNIFQIKCILFKFYFY